MTRPRLGSTVCKGAWRHKIARWKPKLRSEELIELQTTFPLTGQGGRDADLAWQSSPRGREKVAPVWKRSNYLSCGVCGKDDCRWAIVEDVQEPAASCCR